MGVGGGGGGDYFTVTVSRKEVVGAVVPMQEHWLELSNLDLILPAVDVSVFFCYKKRDDDDDHDGDDDDDDFNFGSSMVRVLKKAMGEALVSYYAFAGEILVVGEGDPQLLCNNRGVDFTEAHADVRLEGLNFYNPDHTIEGKLVPKKQQQQHGVLSVQVTELKCGGLVVGCTFDHRIADAYSANMFLVSWAELARRKPLSVVPCFRRSLLSPRPPGCYHPSLNDMYVPISSAAAADAAGAAADHHPLISRIYYVTAEQLGLLQTLASSGKGIRRTKLESFSAFLWKMVAETENDDKKICKMGIVVDGRGRLINNNSSNTGGGDKDKSAAAAATAAMASYFGNVLSIPFGEMTLQELKEKPLSLVADAVHEFLKGAVTKEHFLDLIDWVEAHRPEPALAKIYSSGSRDGPAFVVSSGQRFPVSKVDFGWGRPAFGSYHFPWGGDAGYVMPMPSPNPARDGDWVVYLHLSKTNIEFIETNAGHFFRPLTSEYLNLIN